ncbi:complement factor B-like [Seriola dumerili]|uniref:complement factor B-like n=1 Tax=Seriola dumerili TaxID=41447 RepID=UPI000BBF2821|nr:complement factor B-like [Seriola dumerili]
MGFSVPWSWFAALSCVLCMGGEVWCECTEEGMEIEDGYYSLTRQLQSGSMLFYSCKKGYYPYPVLTRTCQLNGKWRPEKSSPQICKLVECPDPTVLEYGDVSPPQDKYFVGNETTYECYSGHRLRGSFRRVCLPNGKWSGFTPICSRDSGDNCPDPGVPAGTMRVGNLFGIGDKVKYSCSNNNLFLVGSKERTCLENGQWTGTEPECYYKHTYDSPLEASEAFGSAIKESLTTLQPNGNEQSGKNFRISKDGILNVYIAVDISESITEKNVTDAKDTIIKLIKRIASFTVSPNYEIFFFSSEIIEVVNILDFLQNGVQPITIIEAIEAFEIGDHNTAGTDLTLTFETFLSKMAFIKDRVGEKNFTEHHHILMLFTDGAYNMGGSPLLALQKIKNMVYMDHRSGENHPRAEFLDIYVFALGIEVFDEDLQLLTTGLGGKHYFRLDQITNLQKTFDEVIDEDAVMGLCGLHKAIDSYGYKREMYPWSAYINVETGESKTRCLGSLVTAKFVLTAAHCFKRNDLPEHVTVEIEDGHGTMKKVKNFFLHPQYNVSARVDQGVLEFYDYDVALIELKTAVATTYKSRTICIPCTLETNIALKLPKNATCQQQEELLLKDRIEKLNFLTKIKSSVEEKDAYIHRGDTRDACIKHALHAKTIIRTDKAEVAVTDNFLCSGGRTIDYRSHIACTGDSGGAVYKDFEHRTVQIGVVSWGNKKMCSGGSLKESDSTSRDFFLNLFRVVPFLKSIIGVTTSDGYSSLTFLE